MTEEERKQKKKEYMREWRERNREHVKEYAKNYYYQIGKSKRQSQYPQNRKKYNEQTRRWRLQHIERSREIGRNSHARHRNALHDYDRKRYEENKEYFREKSIRWRQQNRLKRAQTEAKRRAYKRQTTIMPVDYEAIAIRDKMTCYLCGLPITQNELSFDHVIPLSKNGSHTMENIRATHLTCNLKKKDKSVCPFRPCTPCDLADTPECDSTCQHYPRP